jgi:AAA+ superfamily predicted ATPase
MSTKNETIVIRVSADEKNELNNQAEELNMTLTGYIRSILFDEEVEGNQKSIEEYIEILKKRIEKFPPNTKFTIKEVLGVDWREIKKGKKLALGRKFKKLVDEDKIDNVKFEKTQSNNTALYEKY